MFLGHVNSMVMVLRYFVLLTQSRCSYCIESDFRTRKDVQMFLKYHPTFRIILKQKELLTTKYSNFSWL